MIIQRNYSSAKDRVGIGWIQEKNGKNESEKILKEAQKAADNEKNKGGDLEDQVKASKRAAGRVVLKKDIPGTAAKGLITGGLTIGAGKLISKKFPNGVGVNLPAEYGGGVVKLSGKATKNIGKYALPAGLVVGGYNVAKDLKKKKTIAKYKAARNGAEINTRYRNK